MISDLIPPALATGVGALLYRRFPSPFLTSSGLIAGIVVAESQMTDPARIRYLMIGEAVVFLKDWMMFGVPSAIASTILGQGIGRLINAGIAMKPAAERAAVPQS